jgi:hypothetical protein
MRAWTPTTEQAVEALLADGAKRIVAFPLYPQRTRPMSVSSVRELYRVLKAKGVSLPVHEICCFPKDPLLLDAWADNVRETLTEIPEDRRAATHVLFSAHGLPQSLIDKGDPYLEHVKLTVAGVMERVGKDRPHTLAFQSRATGAKWLDGDAGRAGRPREEGREGRGVVPSRSSPSTGDALRAGHAHPRPGRGGGTDRLPPRAGAQRRAQLMDALAGWCAPRWRSRSRCARGACGWPCSRVAIRADCRAGH